jgi:hypothetical protein
MSDNHWERVESLTYSAVEEMPLLGAQRGLAGRTFMRRRVMGNIILGIEGLGRGSRGRASIVFPWRRSCLGETGSSYGGGGWRGQELAWSGALHKTRHDQN